jgi:hypothetical protein
MRGSLHLCCITTNATQLRMDDLNNQVPLPRLKRPGKTHSGSFSDETMQPDCHGLWRLW